MVFKRDAFIDGDVILDFDEIANRDPTGHVDILPENTMAADARAGLYMSEVPDLCARTNFHSVIDYRVFIDVILHKDFLDDQLRADLSFFRELKHTQDLERMCAISQRQPIVADAIVKMALLQFQWLSGERSTT